MTASFYHILIIFICIFPEDVSKVCDDLVRYDCYSSSSDCKLWYVQFITISVVS